MRTILFEIGSIKIYSFGFFIAIGFCVAFLVGMMRADKKELDKEQVLNMGLIGLTSGMLGAKLLFVIINFRNITASNWYEEISSGFVVYGGLICGILCVVAYCNAKKLPTLRYCDLLVPSVALAQGVGRIGCFMAGCCYGRETNSIFGVVFPMGSLAPGGIKLIPTQLISSFGDFAIALVLLSCAKKMNRDGALTSMYLILYGIGRFVIEMYRNDPRGSAFGVSTSQLISIVFVMAGVGLITVGHRKETIQNA